MRRTPPERPDRQSPVEQVRGKVARQCEMSSSGGPAFLDRWLRATGRPEYHPHWDLLDVFVSMGGAGPSPRLDEFVATAA